MLEWGPRRGWWSGSSSLALRPCLPELFTDDPRWSPSPGFLLFVVVAVLQPINGVVFVLDGLLIGAGDVALPRLGDVVAAACPPRRRARARLDLGIGWLWAWIAVLMVVRMVTLGWRWSTDAWAITGAAR